MPRQKPPNAGESCIGRLHGVEAPTTMNMLVKVRRSQSSIAEVDHRAGGKLLAILRQDGGNHSTLDNHDGPVNRLIRGK